MIRARAGSLTMGSGPNIVTPLELEGGQLGEQARAGVDFAAFERGEALHAEFFHCETSQHRAVNHGVAQSALVDLPRACKVAHETTCKTIARTGRIVYFFQRKRRHGEQE